MKTHTVRCEWDDTGVWVVTVPAIAGAVTQSRRLDQVRDDVAEVIELLTGQTPGTYGFRLLTGRHTITRLAGDRRIR